MSDSLEKIRKKALDSMEAYAKEVGVTGVAICLSSNNLNKDEWQSVMRIIGASKTIAEDKSGYNFIAIAYSKAAESIETGENSGQLKRPLIVGEFGFKGSAVGQLEGVKVMTVFSGSTEDMDLEIAKVGLSNITSL